MFWQGDSLSYKQGTHVHSGKIALGNLLCSFEAYLVCDIRYSLFLATGLSALAPDEGSDPSL